MEIFKTKMSTKFDRYEVDDSDDYYVDERTVKGSNASTEVMKRFAIFRRESVIFNLLKSLSIHLFFL